MSERSVRPRKRLLRSPEEIPEFVNEEEEANFWDSVDFGEELWSHGKPLRPEELALLPPPWPAKDPVTVRFGGDIPVRLQALAGVPARQHGFVHQIRVGGREFIERANLPLTHAFGNERKKRESDHPAAGGQVTDWSFQIHVNFTPERNLNLIL